MMNMGTMNPIAAGGPVGGGMMMMNSGSPAVSAGMSTDASKSNLNTYILDYLLKHGHYEAARGLARDDKFEFRRGSKLSPGGRKDGDMNGDGGDGIDMDQKDDAPDDLPRPANWDGTNGNGFLLEWYSIFMDLFSAHRMGGKMNGPAAQYLQHEKNNQRLRESLQNQNINRPGMNQAMMQRMQNGAMNGKIPGNMTQQQVQQLQQKRAQMAMQQQMNRAEQTDGEMNGVRPGTPAEGDNGGSPSKRPRIDNNPQFQTGMMQNGRPAGVPGQTNQGMLMQSTFNPNMNPQFQRNGAMPPKGMQATMPNGMMSMGGASSPMMQNMNQFPEGMQMDMYSQRNMQGGQQMQPGAGAQSGNHALQDYQMQLMLLEQQNKKRLMMARQEQHENNPGNGPMPGVNMSGTGMSPSGSRTGTSPNPGEMKRGPGMGLPGSPSAGEAMAGRSPAAMAGFNMMQGPDFNVNNPIFMGKDQMMTGGPPGMRPPTSADVNIMRGQGGRPNQFQGGQPMTQQGSQAGQQLGTPGQRTEMPPPQAPAGGSAQRNGGGSPSGNAPPTPSQPNKPNPKNKKGAAKEDAKRQRPNKKGSTANAPSSDENPPATPTPSTPITPNNPGVMNAGNKGQPGMQPGVQHQQSQAMQMNQNAMQQNDMNQFAPFEPSGGHGEQFNLDFSTLENADVLENFDFDSFLNTSADDGFNFNADVDITAEFGMGQND